MKFRNLNKFIVCFDSFLNSLYINRLSHGIRSCHGTDDLLITYYNNSICMMTIAYSKTYLLQILEITNGFRIVIDYTSKYRDPEPKCVYNAYDEKQNNCINCRQRIRKLLLPLEKLCAKKFSKISNFDSLSIYYIN